MQVTWSVQLSEVACLGHYTVPEESNNQRRHARSTLRKQTDHGCGGGLQTLQPWLAAPRLFLSEPRLICCKKNTWCLNRWVLKCRLVCGLGQSIPHCWGCRCSWMVHNYSLKKLQTAIEPTQTLIAHAKLSPTGNNSVVILKCTCPTTTHLVHRILLDFEKLSQSSVCGHEQAILLCVSRESAIARAGRT